METKDVVFSVTAKDLDCMLDIGTKELKEKTLQALKITDISDLAEELLAMSKAVYQTAGGIKDKNVQDYLKFLALKFESIADKLTAEFDKQDLAIAELLKTLDILAVKTAKNATNMLMPKIVNQTVLQTIDRIKKNELQI